MMKYVPSDSGKYKTCILQGDQLTTERTRSLQMLRATSATHEDRLDGLQPSHADWHAEVTFLQVSVSIALLTPSGMHTVTYSPGRQHRACHVTSSVLQSLNADAYIGWLHKQKVKLTADHKFKQLLA